MLDKFPLSSDLMCFPRIQSRDFTNAPSDKELICQVTTNSSLVRLGEFDFYSISKTTLLLVRIVILDPLTIS